MAPDILVALASMGLLALAVVARRLADSWLFPPALFSAVWAGNLVFSLVVHYGDLSITPPALLVFLTGAVLFASTGIGLWLGRGLERAAPALPRERSVFMRRIILAYSIGLIVLFPFYLQAIRNAIAQLSIEDLASGARTVTMGGDIRLVPRYFQSLLSIGGALTLLMAWLYDGSRRDRLLLALSLGSWLANIVLALGRTPVFVLVIGVGSILAFRRKISLVAAIVGLALTAVAAIAMGSVLGKGLDLSTHTSLVEAVARNLGVYFVGGPVGFAHVMDRPTRVGELGLSLRLFTQALQSFGYSISLPNNILGFDTTDLGNVYTMYFAYWLDWAWWGVAAVGIAAGAFATWLYIAARRGNPIAGVGLGIAFPALLNSATGDGLFGSSIPWILIVLIVGSLWRSPWPRSTS